MANEFYQQGPERASRVRQLFDGIAPRYDLVNDVQSFCMHRHWKRELIKESGIQPGMLGLDVCSGTGDVAFLVQKAGARVVGVDFSVPMLRVAMCRQSDLTDHSRVQFAASDALKLPFPDCSFDCITISYGLRNLADIRAGLREMLRVLKPGGRLVVLDFGKPDFKPWRLTYFGYLRVAVPIFGWVFHRNPAAYAYILESLVHYPAQHGVKALMDEVGFVGTGIRNFMGGVMTFNIGHRPKG